MKLNKINLRRRGMVLVGVMMVLMMLMAVALIGLGGSVSGSMSDSTTGSLRLTRSQLRTYQAQYLADTGVRAVIQWLNVQSSAPTTMTPFKPSDITTFWTGTTANGNYNRITYTNPSGATIGTIDVRLFPLSDNNVVTMRSFIVESVGTYEGKQQIVRATIIQDTFAKYAFFSDDAPTGTLWTAGSTIFNGPVHVNARNMVSGSPNYNASAAIKILWKNTNGNTIFRFNGDGAFTTAAASNQVTWYRDTTSTVAAPSGTTQWARVAVGGQNTVKAGVAAVDMPTQSTRQLDAALGSPPATIPAGPGVTLPRSGGATSGGIYINGNVDNMRMTASGTNNTVQTFQVDQNDGTKKIRTTVVVDPAGSGTTTVRRYETTNMTATTYTEITSGGYPVSATGRTNGVVYVAGNIGTPSVATGDGTPTTWATGGLSGKIANSIVSGSTVTTQSAFNIVTSAENSININGDIVFASSLVSGAPATNAGILGIVSKKVQIVNNLANDDNADGTGVVTVHGTVMAYDTFNAEDPLNRPLSTFNLLGGYIVKAPGTFAGVDSNGTQWTGLTVNRNYDSRVANTPPPFFPSTGNQYKLRSYQRVAATL